MPGLVVNLTLTILSGQTESESLDLVARAGGIPIATNLVIQSPVTLPETITARVSVLGSRYSILQSGGADVTIPADRATQVIGVISKTLKLYAGVAVASDRVFDVSVGVL